MYLNAKKGHDRRPNEHRNMKVLLISMKSFRKSFGTMKNDSKWLGPGSTRSRDAKASS